MDPVFGNPNNPGDPVRYLVTLTNIGSADATDFAFHDALPDSSDFVWDMDHLAYFNGAQHDGLQWISQNLRRREGSYLFVPAGTNNVLNISLRGTLGDSAHIGDILTNTSSIVELDQFYNNYQDDDSARAIVENSDLFVRVDPVGSAPMYDKDPVVWRITLGNNGNMDATNVALH
ncbi:MAG: DUF11 domain-containing protein [bacterium]|nr:DUF11 domain-containing protein [bacterium]